MGGRIGDETILGKMVKEALLAGGIRVKTRIMIDNHGKVCKKSTAGRENSKNKDKKILKIKLINDN